jgi:hypothetical protein
LWRFAYGERGPQKSGPGIEARRSAIRRESAHDLRR